MPRWKVRNRAADVERGERCGSASILDALRAGAEVDKPGWVWLNLSPLLSDAKAERIIGAVDELARTAETYCEDSASGDASTSPDVPD